ncbi:MAG TPA: hypothetical protein DCL54_15465, partial [Alphaproteobacteria bacterium]|nr:hypothetical protein [Alphaproteobacteria bacterium]
MMMDEPRAPQQKTEPLPPVAPPTAVTLGKETGAPAAAVANSKDVKVAILLPLNHKDKQIRSAAKSLLDAAQMAVFDSNSKNLVLMPGDTGSTPEEA